MTETLHTLYPSWFAKGRMMGLIFQLLLWGFFSLFYFAWNNRYNFHFNGPIWSLVLIDLLFAIGLFNALVYVVIPRWLLPGRVGLVLLSLAGLVYCYGLWTYGGYQLALTYLPLSPDLARYYQRVSAPGLSGLLLSWQGFLSTALLLESAVWCPTIISFFVYASLAERHRLSLERNQLTLAVNNLKSQLNPQLLFSTLRNLLVLTRRNDPSASVIVLQLADLMRYTLYESATERVLLSRELDFLTDYLTLQQLGADAYLTVDHVVEGTVTTQYVSPLLVYSLLEPLLWGQAITPPGSVQLTSRVRVSAKLLLVDFTRVSSSPVDVDFSSLPTFLMARRRLQVHYPDQYTLRVHQQPTTVSLQLQLQL